MFEGSLDHNKKVDKLIVTRMVALISGVLKEGLRNNNWTSTRNKESVVFTLNESHFAILFFKKALYEVPCIEPRGC